MIISGSSNIHEVHNKADYSRNDVYFCAVETPHAYDLEHGAEMMTHLRQELHLTWRARKWYWNPMPSCEGEMGGGSRKHRRATFFLPWQESEVLWISLTEESLPHSWDCKLSSRISTECLCSNWHFSLKGYAHTERANEFQLELETKKDPHNYLGCSDIGNLQCLCPKKEEFATLPLFITLPLTSGHARAQRNCLPYAVELLTL